MAPKAIEMPAVPSWASVSESSLDHSRPSGLYPGRTAEAGEMEGSGSVIPSSKAFPSSRICSTGNQYGLVQNWADGCHANLSAPLAREHLFRVHGTVQIIVHDGHCDASTHTRVIRRDTKRQLSERPTGRVARTNRHGQMERQARAGLAQVHLATTASFASNGRDSRPLPAQEKRPPGQASKTPVSGHGEVDVVADEDGPVLQLCRGRRL